MSIDFKARDYLDPVGIFRTSAMMARSEKMSAQALRSHQLTLLKKMMVHCGTHIPYYRRLFKDHNLDPLSITSPDDLTVLPLLTRELLASNAKDLNAEGFNRYGPVKERTSGTGGRQVSFYLDRASKTLEFCYYWRFFSWHGYRLRDPICELSAHHFMVNGGPPIQYQSLPNRLILNASQLSPNIIGDYITQIKKHGCRFIKGSPSTLYAMSLLGMREGIESKGMDAAFTTGEMITPLYRKTIESFLGCSLADSYGHMERTVAICQCEHGKYHINSDYGLLQIKDDNVIGTSLHNLAMPLLRYDIGDRIRISEETECECGRKFPLVDSIDGRPQDILISPDGRLITNAFLLLDLVEGVEWIQIVQPELDKLFVDYVPAKEMQESALDRLLSDLRSLMGEGVTIGSRKLSPDDIPNGKYKPIVSTLDPKKEIS